MKKRILLWSALGIAAGVGVAFVKYYPVIKAKLSSKGEEDLEVKEEVKEDVVVEVSAETTEVVTTEENDRKAFIEKIKGLSIEKTYTIIDLLDKEDKVVLMEALIKLGGIEGVKTIIEDEETMELTLIEKLSEEQYNKLKEMYEKYKDVVISL